MALENSAHATLPQELVDTIGVIQNFADQVFHTVHLGIS